LPRQNTDKNRFKKNKNSFLSAKHPHYLRPIFLSTIPKINFSSALP
jgi:hypothetical protein